MYLNIIYESNQCKKCKICDLNDKMLKHQLLAIYNAFWLSNNTMIFI